MSLLCRQSKGRTARYIAQTCTAEMPTLVRLGLQLLQEHLPRCSVARRLHAVGPIALDAGSSGATIAAPPRQERSIPGLSLPERRRGGLAAALHQVHRVAWWHGAVSSRCSVCFLRALEPSRSPLHAWGGPNEP